MQGGWQEMPGRMAREAAEKVAAREATKNGEEMAYRRTGGEIGFLLAELEALKKK